MQPTGNRLVAVDGLRGIAAICVAVMHSHIAAVPVLRGYLAVDFFFVLSGYVIARGYEPRFAAGLSLRDYARARIERLYPMLAIGSALGILAWVIGLSSYVPTGRADLARAIVGQLAMVPYLSSASSLAFDAALWSISFELLANLTHRAVFPHLTARRLPMLIAAAFAICVALAHRYGSLNIGWIRESSLGGLGRVMFGFFVGVLLHRTEAIWQPLMPRLPFAFVALLLVGLANMPVPSHGYPLASTLYDLAVVAVAMPLLVMLGVVARGAGRVALALGVLSYPIYAIHVPLVDAMRFAGWSDGVRLAAIVPIAIAAWGLGRHVDEPLNAWRRAARRKAAGKSAAAQLRTA